MVSQLITTNGYPPDLPVLVVRQEQTLATPSDPPLKSPHPMQVCKYSLPDQTVTRTLLADLPREAKSLKSPAIFIGYVCANEEG